MGEGGCGSCCAGEEKSGKGEVGFSEIGLSQERGGSRTGRKTDNQKKTNTTIQNQPTRRGKVNKAAEKVAGRRSGENYGGKNRDVEKKRQSGVKQTGGWHRLYKQAQVTQGSAAR